MSWSSKQKTKYFGVAFFVALALLIYLFFSIFYTAPSCVDKKQNQGELGVDCGGPCELLCGFKIIRPITQWSRITKTSEGVYNVVAMIENTNVSAEAYAIPYQFRLYDAEGVLISEIQGSAFIPANSIFPVFESNLKTGQRIPARANFEFADNIAWVEEKPATASILIKDIKYAEKNDTPRVSATIVNNSLQEIKKLELVALLYNNENLVNSSKTIVDIIQKDSEETIIFTWPQLFEQKISRIDIVPVSKIK